MAQNEALQERKQLSQDVLKELNKARGFLMLARRFVSGSRVAEAEEQRVELALAEAMRICIQVAAQSKQHALYRLSDSGIDGARVLGACMSCLEPSEPAPSSSYPVSCPEPGSVLSLLDEYRRSLIESIQRLRQDGGDEERLRAALLRKIFLQLAMVLGIECKLRGEYPIRECDPDPETVRQTLADWATHATHEQLRMGRTV